MIPRKFPRVNARQHDLPHVAFGRLDWDYSSSIPLEHFLGTILTTKWLWKFYENLKAPLRCRTHPKKEGLIKGLLNHHCPINNPLMRPHFFGGGMGLLTSNHLGFADFGDFKWLPKKVHQKRSSPQGFDGWNHSATQSSKLWNSSQTHQNLQQLACWKAEKMDAVFSYWLAGQ